MTTALETTEQRYIGGYPAASRYTAMSTQTLRRLVQDGALRAYKPTGSSGRKIVFDRVELDALIRGNSEPANDI